MSSTFVNSEAPDIELLCFLVTGVCVCVCVWIHGQRTTWNLSSPNGSNEKNKKKSKRRLTMLQY